ncbi:MAG TPA: GWxTD domain-containing protein [Thermoanaerobaculia bacterium]|nr:GWxTD domain-containing protein [Thermoanaerobaculia bacterium]
MGRPSRPAAALAAASIAAAVAACGSLPTEGETAARGWAAGPVRWLLLPEEERTLAGITSSGELAAFLQEFWRRRDDDPSTPDISSARRFQERVAAADSLYGEGKTRGSLTARGGALILLGPPAMLRYTSRRVPVYNPRQATAATRATQQLTLEIWVYRGDELPLQLRQALGIGSQEELSLSFLMERRRSSLVEGRELLAAAARAWVYAPSP